MAHAGVNLDFLALFDDVADDTVSQLVNEIGSGSDACELGDRDTLDMLSICDSTSESNNMASRSARTDFAATLADDQQHVLQYCFDEVSSEISHDLPATQSEANPAPVEHQPSQSARSNTISSTGQKVLPKRRSRWYFSKVQKQQLDEVFKRTMYPSKWRFTELSRALEVPVHTLRNRRWRLRKRHGVSGDFRHRGSRTMLPDKEDSVLCDEQSAANPSLNTQSSVLGTLVAPIPKTAVYRPLKPAISLTTTSANPSSAPFRAAVSSNSASVLSLLSAPRPLLGEVRHDVDGYSWDMSTSFYTGWSLPSSLCWSAGTAYPLAHPWPPWQNYGLSLYPSLYPSDTSATVGQRLVTASMVESRSSSDFLPSSSCTQGEDSQLQFAIAACPDKSSYQPMTSVKLPTVDQTIFKSAQPDTVKLVSMEESSGLSVPTASVNKDSQASKSLVFANTCTTSAFGFGKDFSPALVSSEAPSSALDKDQIHSHTTTASPSVSYTGQSVCPYYQFLAPVAVPAWSASLSYSRENHYQPFYQTTVPTSFTGIPGSSVLPHVAKAEGGTGLATSFCSSSDKESNRTAHGAQEERLASPTNSKVGDKEDEYEIVDVTTCTDVVENTEWCKQPMENSISSTSK